MAELLLSGGEKTYIIHGIQQSMRLDGRDNEDYRYMELESDMVPHCCGSARLRLANTDVLVGVKAEISEPLPNRPNEGYLSFFIDCSANATPAFEGRGGEALASTISSMLATAYEGESTIDLTKLCIQPRKKCWNLYIDILLLEVGGNLFDAVSIAVKAALYNTRIPNLTVTTCEYRENEIEVSDDPFDCFRLDVTNAPCLVTLNKIKDHYIVDATLEEETCVTSKLISGVTRDGTVTGMKQEGTSSFKNIITMTEISKRVGKVLNSQLMVALKKEEFILNGAHQSPMAVRGFLR